MASRGDKTRQRIVDQTVRDIREHGYEQVSLRTLAGELELTTGSVYRHFASKEELLNAAGYEMSRIVDGIVVPAETGSDNAGHDVETLLAIANRLLQLMRDDPHGVEFLFFGPLYNTATQQFGEVEQPRFLTTLLGICTRLCEQYSTTANPNRLFVQIWAFIQGYGNLVMRGVAGYSASMLRETLLSLLSEPLPGPSAPSPSPVGHTHSQMSRQCPNVSSIRKPTTAAWELP
ncbi:TetR/AcrR family transcriptional regulator [Bifidobacterium sp.]|uniref:TetR/AcrR family transcriptional regulator n=1 Tax=Bifidobacterium sp. TaxID=41200 RepID=UPI0025BD4FBC|nr:TetR/AcrR family transcriptional regulator [Bifidobacterium sp.]MCH4208969.1 TetR/AcrR family transcriptional regulator [Bifidobacterium sp.]